MIKATFDEIAGLATSDAGRERLFVKQLASYPCPRCVADGRLKQEIVSELEFKIYKQFTRRPHRCGKDGFL